MAHGDHLKVIDGGSSSKFKVGSAEWAERLRQETKILVDRVETDYMRLAEKLWMIYDTPKDGDPSCASVCTSWKDKEGNYYASFDKYVQAELNIHHKKAQRLRAIWKTFKIDLQLDDKMLERVVKLGFSKVRELAREGLLTRRNVESWVERAEKMTVLKLMTKISDHVREQESDEAARRDKEEFEREYNGSLGSEPAARERTVEHDDEDEQEEPTKTESEQRSKFYCPLFGDQIETVNLAIKRASELSNSDKLGHNLSLICLDFLSTNDFKFADEQSRLRFLAKFEKLMGYKLIIVDPEGGDDGKGEVVYGIKTLEKMARSE